jgi:predicted nucleic acid-binding protein
MYLVDTNVLSEPTRRTPNPAVLAWLGQQRVVRVSAISVMELEFGIERLEGARRRNLLNWLEQLLASPAHQLVPVDVSVARAAGHLKRLAEASGRPRALADLLIAASAQVSGSVVATRNTPDFEGLGVALLNPFMG